MKEGNLPFPIRLGLTDAAWLIKKDNTMSGLAPHWTTPGIIRAPERDLDEELRDLEERERRRNAEKDFSKKIYDLIVSAYQDLSALTISGIVNDVMENLPMMAFRVNRAVH